MVHYSKIITFVEADMRFLLIFVSCNEQHPSVFKLRIIQIICVMSFNSRDISICQPGHQLSVGPTNDRI